MYIQELSLEIKSDIEKNQLVDDFLYLLICYRKSGQSQSDNEAFYISGNILKCNIVTLEKNSLDKKYNTEWVTNELDKLENLCSSKLQIKIIGTTYNKNISICECKKHDYLILFTHLLNEAGPFECGTCFKTIPIYKFSNIDQIFRENIFDWERNYIACDELQMGCTVGEKWATKQMSDPKSELSKQGLEICAKIKELTGIPTYYYLYNYRKIKIEKDKMRTCLSCGSPWILEQRLGKLYDFKCDICGLLSTITSNGY